MTRSNIATISVKYEFIKDHHIFTSKDVPGMLVVSEDPKEAYNSVKESMEILLWHNKKIKVEVTALLSFEEFLSLQRRQNKTEHDEYPILSNRQYLAAAAVA